MPTKPEDVIRRYLVALNDPTSLVDAKLIAGLERDLAKASDPLDRLLLTSKLRAAQKPDLSSLETQFVKYAKSYGDAKGIVREDYAAQGVPADVLKRAYGSAPKGKVTQGRVSSEEVRAAILGQKKGATFTVQSVKAPGHVTTVKRVVEDLVQAGDVEKVGPDLEHEGRGARPTLYKRV